MNYGINSWVTQKINLSDYKIGNIYDKIEDYGERKYSPMEKKGFHLWKNPKGEKSTLLDDWNRYLMKRNQPKINSILICKIDKQDILKEDMYRVIVKKFKVIKEL